MMYLAFKHGTNNGPLVARLLDKLISMRTNGPAVHVEIVFSDGLSFSSSQWDGGVRFKKIEYATDNKWVLVPLLNVTVADEQHVRNTCELLAQMKIKYDWKGILGFMIGKKDPGDPDKFFCSEICTWVLQQVGLFSYMNPSSTDPWLLECVARQRSIDYATTNYAAF